MNGKFIFNKNKAFTVNEIAPLFNAYTPFNNNCSVTDEWQPLLIFRVKRL